MKNLSYTQQLMQDTKAEMAGKNTVCWGKFSNGHDAHGFCSTGPFKVTHRYEGCGLILMRAQRGYTGATTTVNSILNFPAMPEMEGKELYTEA